MHASALKTSVLRVHHSSKVSVAGMARLLSVLCLWMISCSASFAADALAGRRPNIIFLITDDQGYGDIAANGNPVIKTPNLDRLHREGVRFEDFIVSPTCAPTRASVITGRHEFKNGVTHTILERERLTPKATTLAEVLKLAGYATGIFGKWHLGDEPDRWPSKRGFDEMFIHGAGGIGQSYPGSCGDAPNNSYFNPAILHNGKFVKTEGYCTDVFFRQAQEWIGANKGKQPFLAWIATNAPHAPLNCPPEYEALYPNQPKNVAAFLGMITNIDDNVGRLLGKLKEWNIDQDTLLVFINDNGGTAGTKVFNAGMRGQKGTPFMGGIRASSFWRWPGTLKPTAVTKLAAHIDIFPTFAELAGVKLSDQVRQQVEGRSLVPLLNDSNAPWADRQLFTHVGRWEKGTDPNLSKHSNCSVRNSQFHLVATKRGQWELFDLKNDPGESQDVAGAHPTVVRELTEAYDKWWTETVPLMDNEQAVGPKVNPFKELYWQQFGKPDTSK